jgi:hypothetical protein
MNFSTKSAMSVDGLLRAISDEESLEMFTHIANMEKRIGSINGSISNSSDKVILGSKMGLTNKQFYSRISRMIETGLIKRKNKKYYLTSFGKVVFSAIEMVKDALDDYWKLKAVDSIAVSPSNNKTGLPAEERDKLIDMIFANNSRLRDLLGVSSKQTPSEANHVDSGVVLAKQTPHLDMKLTVPAATARSQSTIPWEFR